MSKCPVQGGGLGNPRGLTSKKVILAAVLMVAVLTVSCLVFMDEHTDESDAIAYASSVWVDGKEIPGDGSTVHITGANARYSSETGTLSITFDTGDSEIPFKTYLSKEGYSAIYSPGDLTIVTSANKTIVASTYEGEDLESLAPTRVYGIRCLGNLTISGNVYVKACKALNDSIGV